MLHTVLFTDSFEFRLNSEMHSGTEVQELNKVWNGKTRVCC
jgi:hypothetical protein